MTTKTKKITTEDAEKLIAEKITRLSKSKKQIERKEAGQLGELLGAWRRGRIGDQMLINAAC